MSEGTAATPQPALPQTAADALKVWDAGQPLRAFQVETEGTPQEKIYDAAFFWIRAANPALDNPRVANFSLRERVVAHSIAFVALRVGWAQMVLAHTHPNSPEITIHKGE